MMLSPRPIPSWLISAVRCSLPNLLNSRGMSSRAMPSPESVTEIVSLPCSPLVYLTATFMKPSVVNLIAFLIKFIKIYLILRSSPISLGMFMFEAPFGYNSSTCTSASNVRFLKFTWGWNMFIIRFMVPTISNCSEIKLNLPDYSIPKSSRSLMKDWTNSS